MFMRSFELRGFEGLGGLGSALLCGNLVLGISNFRLRAEGLWGPGVGDVSKRADGAGRSRQDHAKAVASARGKVQYPEYPRRLRA